MKLFIALVAFLALLDYSVAAPRYRRDQGSKGDRVICATISGNTATVIVPDPCIENGQVCSSKVRRVDGQDVTLCSDRQDRDNTICAELSENGMETPLGACSEEQVCHKTKRIREGTTVRTVKFCGDIHDDSTEERAGDGVQGDQEGRRRDRQRTGQQSDENNDEGANDEIAAMVPVPVAPSAVHAENADAIVERDVQGTDGTRRRERDRRGGNDKDGANPVADADGDGQTSDQANSNMRNRNERRRNAGNDQEDNSDEVPVEGIDEENDDNRDSHRDNRRRVRDNDEEDEANDDNVPSPVEDNDEDNHDRRERRNRRMDREDEDEDEDENVDNVPDPVQDGDEDNIEDRLDRRSRRRDDRDDEDEDEDQDAGVQAGAVQADERRNMRDGRRPRN